MRDMFWVSELEWDLCKILGIFIHGIRNFFGIFYLRISWGFFIPRIWSFSWNEISWKKTTLPITIHVTFKSMLLEQKITSNINYYQKFKVQRTGFHAVFEEVSEFQSACGGKAAVIAPIVKSVARNERPADAVFITSANFPGIILFIFVKFL